MQGTFNTTYCRIMRRNKTNTAGTYQLPSRPHVNRTVREGHNTDIRKLSAKSTTTASFLSRISVYNSAVADAFAHTVCDWQLAPLRLHMQYTYIYTHENLHTLKFTISAPLWLLNCFSLNCRAESASAPHPFARL